MSRGRLNTRGMHSAVGGGGRSTGQFARVNPVTHNLASTGQFQTTALMPPSHTHLTHSVHRPGLAAMKPMAEPAVAGLLLQLGSTFCVSCMSLVAKLAGKARPSAADAGGVKCRRRRHSWLPTPAAPLHNPFRLASPCWRLSFSDPSSCWCCLPPCWHGRARQQRGPGAASGAVGPVTAAVPAPVAAAAAVLLLVVLLLALPTISTTSTLTQAQRSPAAEAACP